MVEFLLHAGLQVCHTAQHLAFSLKETTEKQVIKQEIKG